VRAGPGRLPARPARARSPRAAHAGRVHPLLEPGRRGVCRLGVLQQRRGAGRGLDLQPRRPRLVRAGHAVPFPPALERAGHAAALQGAVLPRLAGPGPPDERVRGRGLRVAEQARRPLAHPAPVRRGAGLLLRVRPRAPDLRGPGRTRGPRRACRRRARQEVDSPRRPGAILGRGGCLWATFAFTPPAAGAAAAAPPPPPRYAAAPPDPTPHTPP